LANYRNAILLRQARPLSDRLFTVTADHPHEIRKTAFFNKKWGQEGKST